MSEKKFQLTLVIEQQNIPQKWEFKNVSSIEQLAVWMIIKELAEKNIKKNLS